MKLYFVGAEALADAIAIVEGDLGFTTSKTARCAYTVTVEETDKNYVSVELSGKTAKIVYGGGRTRFLRGLATLTGWIKDGIKEKRLEQTPLFISNGAMVDMSRNAVMNVKTVKFMLRKMALMGMNTYMLYTEDTYEIEERPYFGYMRGRYTKDEIRELDAYAITLGVELVPCIQVLGHLATTLRWRAHAGVKDTANVMFVGRDATYDFIEDMFRTVSECFTSKRLHMGMDETHDLGRGSYLDANGYRPFGEIYSEHLARVCEMAKRYGFKPMIWSDMIIRFGGSPRVYDPNTVITPELCELVPKDCELVFWDYYNPGESFYTKNIQNHRALGAHTIFAGGIWTWSGHCPYFSESITNTRPALDACKKEGIDEIFATIWHNGAEASMLTSLAGLAWYADYDYHGEWDNDSIAECFRYCCGESYEDFIALELPEHPHGGKSCISRALLYNDPLVGLVDKHIKKSGADFGGYFAETTKKLKAMRANDATFNYLYDVITALSDLFENKADFGVRLKAAYDAGDKTALGALAAECDVVIEKLEVLRLAHRVSWMEYNKPFGWEILDTRYGGIVSRFATTKDRINDYLNGIISSIEELEAERLYIDGSKDTDTEAFPRGFIWMSYSGIGSVNVR